MATATASKPPLAARKTAKAALARGVSSREQLGAQGHMASATPVFLEVKICTSSSVMHAEMQPSKKPTSTMMRTEVQSKVSR